MTHTIFHNSIKLLISKIGLRPSNFSPHSFRRGGATFAFQAGVPEHPIQQHGDWRSEAYRRYLNEIIGAKLQNNDLGSILAQYF